MTTSEPPVDAVPQPHIHSADISIISNLTDDDQRSVVERFTSNISTIGKEAWNILRGEPTPTKDGQENGVQGVVLFDKAIAKEEPEISVMVPEPETEPPIVDFLQDDPKTMTWGRRVALALLDRKWYNPHAGASDTAEDEGGQPPLVPLESIIERRPRKVTKRETPSLAKAWAYFDHFSLPRFIIKDDGTYDKHDLKRAEPGESEHPTKLYDPICTPLSQMGDFGLGVGLYFSSLRALTIVMLVAGLLNIPNFIYFSSAQYSDEQPGLESLLKGSAICTRTSWVPCEGCQTSDFSADRYATAVASLPNATGQLEDTQLVFALKNNCDGATLQQGMINYGTLLLVLLSLLIMNRYQKQKEVEFDEDEQTAQDYSIRILNPPKDATDPQEWRNYFKEVFDAHATVVTVALDNDPLIRALRERRECLRKIELKVEPGTPLETLVLAKIAAEIEGSRSFWGRVFAMIAPGIPEAFGRMAELEARIRGWAQLDYPCSNVFVTFETEAEQRRVLSSLSLGAYHVKRQNVSKLADARYLFRGNLILKLKEPDEPNTIRWADLNVKFLDKVKPLATTTVCSIATIVVIAIIIYFIHDATPAYAAIAIAVANMLFPTIAKLLTDIERHSSEGLKQTSLYFKIAVFRWVNTAIVITIVTPFTSTISTGSSLIPSIYAIFIAEIVTTNIIQFLDPGGHFQRHFLAPRSNTQDAMNLSMQGAEVHLAERYTNMTKILFLALWYCSVFPGALFMCSFALFVNYFTDRFSLMRTWKRMPQLGTRISRFSRRYFFTTAVVAMAVISAYFWSGFPFDNLCSNDSLSPEFEGDWAVTTGEDLTFLVSVGENSTSYRYCLQDFVRYRNLSFPALSRWQPEGNKWMTEDQESVVNVYGWTSLVVAGSVILFFFSILLRAIARAFSVGYKPVGEDQGIAFSTVPSISAYVPQVSSPMYSYPLLACDTNGVDPDLFDWTDPDRPHSYYDLTMDADELIGDLSVHDKLVFSILSHVPPPER